MPEREARERTGEKSAARLKKSALTEIDKAGFLRSLNSAAAGFDIELDAKQQQQLCVYYERLVETNRRINLTGITEAAEVAQKHVVDSLVLLNKLPDFDSLIDVGSGAGLPGLPLAVARPQAHAVLLDSQRKRCDFLRGVIGELRLPRAEVIWGRAEELGREKDYREGFDLAVARAVAPLPLLLEYLLPLVRVGGAACALKGAKAAEEIRAAERAARELGAEFDPIYEYRLAGEKHALVILRKLKPTAGKYPRGMAAIKKNPL